MLERQSTGSTAALDRWLSVFDGDAPGTRRSKVRAFQIVVVLVVWTEYWTQALRDGFETTAAGLDLALVTVVAIAVIEGRWRRLGFAALALLQVLYVWSTFPQTGNHRYLELFFAVLLALLDDRQSDELVLLLRGLRLAVVVVLLYAGLQKLVHGYWFEGQFLAWSLWRDTFRAALGPLLPPEEVARLSRLGGEIGDGPYRLSSPPLVVLSNAVWLGELALAALLVPRVSRPYACAAALAFLVLTEVVARELMFGIEFGAAILLFARSDRLRPCVPAAAMLLALAVLVRLGLLPQVTLH